MNNKKSNNPTAVIIHGANIVGLKLAEILSSQKTNLIVIDEFTRANKKQIKLLKKVLSVATYDLSAIKSLTTELKRVDYVFILLDQYLLTNPEISGKKFLSETNVIDATLKLSHKHTAKVLLSSSISIHRKLADPSFVDTDNLSDVSQPRNYSSFELQRYCENLAAEYHDQTGLDIRIARLGEVIGKGMKRDTDTPFVNLVNQAVTKTRLQITGEGLDSSYYVHTLDAVYGLVKANFSNKTNGEVFSLSYKDEISTLSLAYRLLELNPTANEIVFADADPESKPQRSYVPAKNLSKIGWKSKVTFDNALAETTQYFYNEYKVNWKDKPDHTKKATETITTKTEKHASEQTTRFGKLLVHLGKPFNAIKSKILSKSSKVKTREDIKKSTIQQIIFLVTFTLFYILLLAPISQVVAGTTLTYYFGNKAYHEAGTLNIKNSISSLEKACLYSSLMNKGWYGLRWIKIIPMLEYHYEEITELLNSCEHLVYGGHYFMQGAEPYIEYFKVFEPITSFDGSTAQSSREYQTELLEMENKISYIEMSNVEISLATKEIESIDSSIFPIFIQKEIADITSKTQELETALESTQKIAFHIPELLGKDGRKNYVVLFQNPMELRSTGGWLTSYAVIGIEHGQVRTMIVDDVYNADGQLTQKVTPPESMANALGISEWNLSLSNWSPDFSEAADSAAYFLKLENIITDIDGVIAVDIEFVRQLIDIWDEINVPGEQEPVTKDNLYDKVIEIHREFTPGSTAKPVFLSNLANEILLKLFETSRDKWPDIAGTISSSLNEKHIQVYTHNTQVAEILNDLGWSGQIPDKTNIIYPLEWNWGGNKANHFLDRSVTIKSNILNEDLIQQKVTITYKNNSTANQYPEGDYHNFIRIYFPENIGISRVEGIENPEFQNNSTIDMDTLSGWADVPVNSTKIVSVTYTIDRSNVNNFPITVKPDGTVTYELNIIKQAGLQADALTIEISYPEQWRPLDLTNIHRELNTLIRRTDLKTDKEIVMLWEK